tara:strand:- start:25864 stop:26319 length:456 start_codon:yes stop_codon:yes gene_type:complete
MKFLSSLIVVFLVCLSIQSFADGPKFKKGTIQINSKTIKAEFAISDAEQQHGLMNRTEIPDDFGMLFVFEDEDYRSFWMKNTFVNLSIAYIGANKKILEIIDMEASKSSLDANPKTYPSSAKAKYALEVKQGWFAKNKIKVGDSIKKINIK